MRERLRVPESMEELYADWFTQALSARFPEVTVAAARRSDIIRGASTKIRFEMSYEANSRVSLPARLIAKGGFEEHSQIKAEMHVHEALAYKHFVPTLAVNAADCFFAHVDEDGRAVVLIEDLTLRNVCFQSLQEPISFELAAAFLEGLASIHARWWNAPELLNPELFGGKCLASMAEGYVLHNMMDLLLPPTAADVYARFLALPRAAGTPKAIRDGERLRRGLHRLREKYRALPLTVNHGDMHLGNLFVTAEGAPGFLDWQPFKGPWCHDVTYFMVAALDLPDRRRWEAALLQHYLAHLRAHGIDAPSFDEAWLLYRRDVLWGFFVWLINSNAYQGEANNTAATVRFATAMIDHDVYGLIEAGRK